ncbi:MAG: hypothetical protein HWN65_01160 [Candidatus Helarchaeota archaeon]|nr:hypothetical protein [Candidatus Helarchaeota archaeon]
MKKKLSNSVYSLLLIFIIVFSSFVPLLNSVFQTTGGKRSPFGDYTFTALYDNYCYLTNINQTEYLFNAKGACYVLAEVNGTDFTSFQLDNETLDVSYGLNVFPKHFGENFTTHNITFLQNDIDNHNFKWVAVEPLFIKEGEITVNLTGYYNVSFNASGPITILMQPNFSLNWLYLEVDNVVINDIYNTSDYPEIDSAFYSYFVDDGAYLSFSLNMEPNEHTMKIMGNGSIAYKIMPNLDWDEDLISDMEEVQQELFIPQLDPMIPNTWGFFEKSSEYAYFHNGSGLNSGYFSFYIPDSYQGMKYLYIFANSGTISDITVDGDELTLQNITLSSHYKNTPYGILTSGHHFIAYNYDLTESTEISFHIDGEKIIIFDEIEMKDTDADGLKDLLEMNSGLNIYDSDTDQDGLPDNFDPSPIAALTLNKDYLHQIVIPANSSKNTFINIKIKRPDPDYSLKESRIFLEGHSNQPEGLEVLIYPVIRVFGNQTIARNNLFWRWKGINETDVETFSLVDGYDPTGFGDAIPNENNSNAEFVFKFAKESAEVFEFDLCYPKGHLAKDDNVIDLRFDFIWLVIHNSSGKLKPLHYYVFENDIILQSMTVKEVGDVNYILASPDSMIENQILWALNQNPQLGSPIDYNVQDDIVGMGTVDYLELANQTLIDRNNTKRASNETEVLYIAGLQSNYDVLNKIKLQSLVNPSFEVNHSGDFITCFSLYSISNVYNANYSYEDEQIRGKNRICYLISWNNYSTGTIDDYAQRANILAFPIFMQVIPFQNSTILKLTEALGSEIPLTDIPYSTASQLHDKILFRNQTYIEPSDSSQTIPLVNFNYSKHVFKELMDNRQWTVEASRLIFNNYSRRPLSQGFIESYSDFKNAVLNMESVINQIPGLFFNFDTDWSKSDDPSITLGNLDGIIDFINSKAAGQLVNILPKLDPSYMDEVGDYFDDKSLLDHVVAISEAYIEKMGLDFNVGKQDLSDEVEQNKYKSTLKGIASTLQHGVEFIKYFSDSFEIMKDLVEDEYSLDEFEFWKRITESVGYSMLHGLMTLAGIILIAKNLGFAYTKTYGALAKFVPRAIIIIGIVLAARDLIVGVIDAYNTYGISNEFAVEVAFLCLEAMIFCVIPVLLALAGVSWGVSLIIVGALALIFVIFSYLKDASKEAEQKPPPPTIVIVWADEEGHPGTSFTFSESEFRRQGSLETRDYVITNMVFHNTGEHKVMFTIGIGIPEFDGSVEYTYFGGGWWFDPDEYDDFTWGKFIFQPSPNLTLALHLQQHTEIADVLYEVYNETHEFKLYMPVLPTTIGGFYALTTEIPRSTPPSNETSVTVNTSELIDIDPLVGNVSVNLPVISTGYSNPLVKCEISFNDTNFYVDTPNFTQNLDSDLSFTLFSQNFSHLGGLYYMNIDIKLNATDELIFSDQIPFRLLFIRNFTYSQSNILYKKEINQYFYASNITTPVNLSTLDLSVGNILFLKFTPNCTKETYLNLFNNTELVKTHLIIPRGNRDFTQQFVPILIDENITINKCNFSSGLLNSEHILVHDITFINASIQPPENQYFTPFNFTNNGNVPEYVKFTFSGVPFDSVDTSLRPDEFNDDYQLACVMPGEHRECSFNISRPTAISNLFSRSITSNNPIIDSIISRYTDYLAIDGIYIDSPENRTYKLYSRDNHKGLWLNIIPETELTWNAYSLDGQNPVNFSKNAYLPLPADGSHSIQVLGNDTVNTTYMSEIRYFTLESCLINITNPANNSIQLDLWTGIYNATYGFDSIANGSKPPEGEMSGNCYVVNHIDAHAKVLQLKGDEASITYGVNEGFPKSYGTIEFWIRFEDISYYSIEISMKNSGTDLICMWVDWGKWYYYSDWFDISRIPNVNNPQPNTWHHVKIDFRCANASPYLGLPEDRYMITIDGISSGEQTPRLTGRTEYDLIEIDTGEYGYDWARVWIDAVGLSWDPNYDVGDNLDETIPYLLSLEYELPPHVNNLHYSLNNQDLKPLMAPDILPFNETGIHQFQLFGGDIYGDIYESRINYFAVSAIHIPTPAGFNISILETEYTGIQLNYSQVFSNGTTTISLVDVDDLPPLPSAFYLGSYSLRYETSVLTHFCYNITMTEASTTFLRIPYDEDNVFCEKNLRLFRLDQFNTWDNITSKIDIVNNFIYGQTTTPNEYIFAIIEILDTHAPFTRVYLNSTEASIFEGFSAPVTVNFDVIDEFTGVLDFYYSFNGVNWTTFTGSFIIANECDIDFYYYSKDVLGNEESIDSFHLVLDWTPPTTTHAIEGYLERDGKIYVNILSEITLTTTDNFDNYPSDYYRINGGAWKPCSGEITLYDLGFGTYTIEYYARDNLGNSESVHSFTFTYVSQSEYRWMKIQPTLIKLVIIAGIVGLVIVVFIIIIKKRRS